MENIYWILGGKDKQRGWFPVDVNLDGDPKRLYYYVLEDVYYDLPGGRWMRQVQYLIKEDFIPNSDASIDKISFFVSGKWCASNDGQPFWQTTPVRFFDKEGTEEYLKHFFADEKKRSVTDHIFSIFFTQIDKERHPEFYEKEEPKT